MSYYYSRKFEIENAVRRSGLKFYTILRPSFLMHNYLEPLCMAHFPHYGMHTLDVAYPLGTKTTHFDPHDVGRFAAAAPLDPGRFDRQEVELGNEQLTIEQVAEKLDHATDSGFDVNYLDAEQVAEMTEKAPALAIRLWGLKENAYTNDPSALDQYGIPLTNLAEFAKKEEVALSLSLQHLYEHRKDWDFEGGRWVKAKQDQEGDEGECWDNIEERDTKGDWEQPGNWAEQGHW